MIIYFPLLVALLGLLAVGLSDNPKVQQIGYISYGVGLLAFLLRGADKLIDVLR